MSERRDTAAWLPGFLIIGAVKAATTWIQVQLQANPGLFMPDPEPHFFSREFDRGLDFYRQFFADAPEGVLNGEKSADYLAEPEVPARVAQLLPSVRLVVQLRDPVERAYSDYKMLYRRGTVTGPPEDYLLSPDSSQPRFLADGLYGQHLQRWFDHFPRESLLAFLFEDILADKHAVINRVSRHIGVEPCYDAGQVDRAQNNSREKILPLALRKALAPLKDSVKPLRGNPLFEQARSLLAQEIRYPPLARDTQQRLRDYYLKDIERLESLIGRELSAWKQDSFEAVA